MQGSHFVGGQAVVYGVVSPGAVLQLRHPTPGAEPHHTVRAVFDRSHRVGAKTIGNGIGGELTVFVAADPRAYCSRPYGSVRILVNGVNTVLCKSIGRGVGLGGK